jgi:hypothetical protein
MIPGKRIPKTPEIFTIVLQDLGVVYHALAKFEGQEKDSKVLQYLITKVEELIPKLQKNLEKLKALVPPEKPTAEKIGEARTYPGEEFGE